jgi:hypothetical protein
MVPIVSIRRAVVLKKLITMRLHFLIFFHPEAASKLYVQSLVGNRSGVVIEAKV